MREGRFPHLMQHQVGGRFRTLDGTSTVNSGLSKLIHIKYEDCAISFVARNACRHNVAIVAVCSGVRH